VQTSLVAEIAAAYYDLLSLDASLRIVDENIGIQQNALELVRVQKEAGMANELAVEQFEAQLLGLRGQRIEMEQMIVENESIINYLLGRYPQPVQRNSLDLLEMSPPSLVAGVPAQLLRNRPDIRAAELELAASKADLNAARALFYLTVEINGLLGLQAFRPDLLVTKPASFAYGLLGGLTAPLINKRAIQAEFNAADAYQLEALYAYQQAILGGYVEVHNGLAGLRNLQRSLDLKRSEAEVFTRSISTSNDLFRTSRATYLEVLFAQQNALSTRLELVEMKQRELMLGVGVYRALGGGWR
jgi:outer membrane protein TolC